MSFTEARGWRRSSVGYLEVVGVVGVRHQVAVVGALQLEAVRDASVRVAVLAVAAEVGQTFVVAQLLEVLVVVGHPSVAQVFHHTWKREDFKAGGRFYRVRARGQTGVHEGPRQAAVPESGSELRSAHRTMGMADGSEVGEPVATEPEALSAMLLSSDRNIMVWISLTSEYSGSQCMCALATRTSCLSWGAFMPGRAEERAEVKHPSASDG